MVATRNHPRDFEPLPGESPSKPSPTKRTTRNSTANDVKPTSSPAASTRSRTATSPSSPTTTRRRSSEWSHTPSNLTLIWLAISLPLVIWDTGYVLLRPHSMPGGKLHWIWAPYDLYGTVDYAYSMAALEDRYGWTGAQGFFNALETIAYLVYLYIVYTYGEQEPIQGRGAPSKSFMGQLRGLSESRTVYGRMAAIAVLLGFTTATVTWAKTVLYWLIEVFSGFHGIGHNDWFSLIFLWIIPNGPWIPIPAYMMYVFGSEVLQGLETATSKKSK